MTWFLENWWVWALLAIMAYWVYWWARKDEGLRSYLILPPSPSFESWWTQRFTRAELFEHMVKGLTK